LLAGIIGVGARFGVFSGAACVPLLDMIIATISIVSAAGQGALPLAGGVHLGDLEDLLPTSRVLMIANVRARQPLTAGYHQDRG
jgi:hypothetical protein